MAHINLKHPVGKLHSQIIKQKNVDKHLRIAMATTGHERLVHIEKAEKLIERYKFPKLDRTPFYG